MRKNAKLAGLIICVALTGCAGLFSFSPEQSVIQSIQKDRNGSIDPGSLQVFQSQQLDDTAFTLVAYQATGRDGKPMYCTALYQAGKSKIGTWETRGAGIGCGSGTRESVSIFDLSSGQTNISRGQLERSYSYTYGLIDKPEITRVRITWDDGQTQTVDVANDSFLIFREGRVTYTALEWLGRDDTVLYTQKQSE